MAVLMASLTLIFSCCLFLIFWKKGVVEKERLFRTKKEALTNELIFEWLGVKGNAMAINAFIDKMVDWSQDKNKKKEVDFDSIKDAMNSRKNLGFSLHNLYSNELKTLDYSEHSKLPSSEIYIKKRTLIARINFLTKPHTLTNAHA